MDDERLNSPSSLNSAERLAWESRLLMQARKGEAAAFTALYREYAGPLFARVLMPKLGNRDAAEDALAETFRTALERLEQFEARGTSFYYWLARIASNKANDMHRARQASSRALVNLEAQAGVWFEAPQTPDADLNCEADVREFQDNLQRACHSLNPRYREAIELRFYREWSRQQCADAMGVRLGTFDVLLLRALKALRKEWDNARSPLATGEEG